MYSFAIYDDGGNLIQFGEHNYTYDPANRLIKYKHYDNNGIIDSEYDYWYDVDGERIGKCRRVLSENETEEFVFYLRDEEGNVMTEFKSNFCPAEQTPFLSQSAFKAKENNFYLGGRLVSTEKTEGYQLSCPIWHFYHSDHLGTSRVITDEAGNIIATHKYYPYGEEITSQTQNTLNHKFTGHERDFESNLDYMHARYYHQFMGRFLSVDFHYQNIDESPIWNKYRYSLNNPLKYLDPNGKYEIQAIKTTLEDKESRYIYSIKFLTPFEKTKRFSEKIVKFFIKTSLKHLQMAGKTLKKILVGDSFKTDWRKTGVKSIKESDFEKMLKKEFKNLNPKEAAGYSGAYSKAEISEKLQKAIKNVVDKLIENGELTEEEGEMIKKVYDAKNALEEAEKAANGSTEQKSEE